MYPSIRLYAAALGVALATTMSAQNPGQTDQLSVMEAQGVVPTTVRASDSFDAYGPHYMNDIIAAHPAVMGASDWNWSFKNTNGNELPINFNKGDDSRYIRLADVPGIQHGMSYEVQVRPVMASGEITEFGDVVTVAIVTEAPDEGGTDNITEIADRGLETPGDLRVEPKQLSASDREMTVTLGDWVSDRAITTVGIMDADGNIVYKREMNLNAGDQVIIPADDLQAGLYTVRANFDRETRTTRVKVNRAGDRGLEAPGDLRVEPKQLSASDREMTVTLGDWVSDRAITTVGIMDANGNIVYKREMNLNAGDQVIIPADDLQAGLYTVRANFDRETRTTRVKVNRVGDRGLETPGDLRVEPKQLSASDREMTVTLGDWVSDRAITTVGIMDADGNIVYKREMNLNAGDQVIIPADDLQAGLYTVRANFDRETRTTRVKVNRAGNRDFEVVSDLSIEPRVVDGAGLKATLGGWINEQRMTTFMILDDEGKEVMRSEHMAGAGEPVQLDLTELRNGRYTLQAVNLEGRKSQKFEVARDRGFEAPGSDLHVYPNPIRERDMRLKVGSWIDGSTYTGIRIYDDNGVVKGTMTARVEQGETVRMDVSTLQNGDYNVVVVNGRERRNVRISIRR